jgi:hypothetical protein
MTLHAATATQPPIGHGWLVLALLGAACWYALLCAVRPFKPHRRCGGLGRLHAGGGRAWKPCKGWRGCGGHGVKLRHGRRLYAYLKRRHEAGQVRTH